MSQRRQFLREASVFGLASTALWPHWVQAQAQAQKLFWGGLGFSVPAADIALRFPMVSGAIKQIGETSQLVKAMTDQVRANYPAGLEDAGQISVMDDPGPLLNISIDYEQTFAVPSDRSPGKDIQVSFVYANAQVLYFRPPRQGDGDLRLIYSFPFRVQSLETTTRGNRTEQEQVFARLLTTASPSLTSTLGSYLRGRRFREGSAPRRLKVRSVTITPEAVKSNAALGITRAVDPDFVGRCFSVSMTESAGLSVIPFGPAEATTRALAERFDRRPDIGGLIKKLGTNDETDIAVDLVFHRSFSILEQSNNANNSYLRGVSFVVKVTDVIRNQVVFDKKIQLVAPNEIAKAMLDRLADYDMRYIVQIIILLFDTFNAAVFKEDPSSLSKIGLNPAKDMADVKALKALLLTAKYNG
jgi:hypothetical protein